MARGSHVAVAFFFSSRRRHTRSDRDWSSDVCSSDLPESGQVGIRRIQEFACRSQPSGVCVKVKSERIETRPEDEKPQDLVLKDELQWWSHSIPCEPSRPAVRAILVALWGTGIDPLFFRVHR